MLKIGKTQTEIAQIFAVRQQTVSEWWILYINGGMKGLRIKRRGRQKGEKRTLTPEIENEIQKLIVDRCPEQVKLPFVLWTRDAVRRLIRQRYGITMPTRTVGEYLCRWGFTPQNQ